jgi:hypothetical protein
VKVGLVAGPRDGYRWLFSLTPALSHFDDRDDVEILLDELALTLHAKA